MAVLGAAVVEAPVGEDCEAQAGDDHVGLARKRAHVRVYPPPPAERFPGSGAEPRLRGRARAPDAGHDLAALLGSENVSHPASPVPCGPGLFRLLACAAGESRIAISIHPRASAAPGVSYRHGRQPKTCKNSPGTVRQHSDGTRFMTMREKAAVARK
jgi:hypothetical protein